VLDRATGKLFAAAHDIAQSRMVAFAFDTRRLETVKLHSGFAEDKYMRCSFPNGDGSYTFVLHVPGESLLRWDPSDETVESMRINDALDTHAQAGGTSYRLIDDDQGRRYFPRRGWYDPQQRRWVSDRPRPDREMTWFHRHKDVAWGAEMEQGNLRVGRWDLQTGSVVPLCSIPDSQLQSVNVTTAGKLVAVNKYGYFYRFDGETGVLEISRRLPSDSINRVDCLCRIDDERLLGTPFITQRFWEVNLRTGKGYDCGRAAPGGGEILKTWRHDGKVYMAAYTGGELVEYDPAEHPHFPENPRVVAAPPHAMRPVAATEDRRNLYYACSTSYGTHGATVVKYDTVTGTSRYSLNPLGDQQIVSLCYDPATSTLLCGTTMHADCRSCAPTSDQCFFARLDTETLEPVISAPAPDGTSSAVVEGPLAEGQYLCRCVGPFAGGHALCFTLDSTAFRIPSVETMQPLPPETLRVFYAGVPGRFVLWRGRDIEVWDLRRHTLVRRLHDAFDGYSVKVQDKSVYLLYTRTVEVLEDCLSDLG
jgi:hypothetical protein